VVEREMPRTATGKIQHRVLRDRLAAEAAAPAAPAAPAKPAAPNKTLTH
jgi:hypothetical protein